MFWYTISGITTNHFERKSVCFTHITPAQLYTHLRPNTTQSYTPLTVVKLVVQPVWRPAVSCKQTSNGLSDWLSNWFDNRLNEQPLFVQLIVKPGCTTSLTTGCIHNTAGCQTGCQTGFDNGFDNRLNVCIHNTIGCQGVWQSIVSCIQTSNQLSMRFDNRLYRVNGALDITLRTYTLLACAIWANMMSPTTPEYIIYCTVLGGPSHDHRQHV